MSSYARSYQRRQAKKQGSPAVYSFYCDECEDLVAVTAWSRSEALQSVREFGCVPTETGVVCADCAFSDDDD